MIILLSATYVPTPIQIGGSEWLWIILVAAIFLFGSKKIPEVARSLGKAMGEFQKGRMEIEREIRSATEQVTQQPSQPTTSKAAAITAIEKKLSKEEIQKAAAALGIDASTKTEEELLKAIKEKLG